MYKFVNISSVFTWKFNSSNLTINITFGVISPEYVFLISLFNPSSELLFSATKTTASNSRPASAANSDQEDGGSGTTASTSGGQTKTKRKRKKAKDLWVKFSELYF